MQTEQQKIEDALAAIQEIKTTFNDSSKPFKKIFNPKAFPLLCYLTSLLALILFTYLFIGHYLYGTLANTPLAFKVIAVLYGIVAISFLFVVKSKIVLKVSKAELGLNTLREIFSNGRCKSLLTVLYSDGLVLLILVLILALKLNLWYLFLPIAFYLSGTMLNQTGNLFGLKSYKAITYISYLYAIITTLIPEHFILYTSAISLISYFLLGGITLGLNRRDDE